MRQSQLFTKTRKNPPSDEVAKNAQLLIRGGFVRKEMAGVYSYLPLGLRVLTKIENVIREEMDAIGGQEIRMATLHPSENWKKTGGWDGVDVLFKLESRTEKEYALGQSEEEIVTPIAQEYALSYKDLPLSIYQIGQKYRDELRAKSGVMRGREFGMKDMYSFFENQEDFDRFYEIVKASYIKAFKRCGLDAKVTEASGGSFSEKLSYEFMVLSDAGEDWIIYCDSCSYAANIEILEAADSQMDPKEYVGKACSRCSNGKLQHAKAVEAGNIFDLGTKYPKAFGYTYKDKEGKEQTPVMGCYGFGTTRLVGTIVETFADEKGMVWPESVAPFALHLVSLGQVGDDVSVTADALYEDLQKKGMSVLYDDRDLRAGEKFADSDLIGIPHRIVVGKQGIADGTFELVHRATGEVVKKSREEILAL